LFYFLIFSLVTAVAGEYVFFSQKLDNQRRQILVLTTQNNRLQSKINKQQKMYSSLKIKFIQASYKYGYTTENTSILLSPIEESPIVYKCMKSVKVAVSCTAEVQSQLWYEVELTVNSTLLKGWVKESQIKLMVEDNCV
jgi:hypothetical protein